jgi:hypothetical protein
MLPRIRQSAPWLGVAAWPVPWLEVAGGYMLHLGGCGRRTAATTMTYAILLLNVALMKTMPLLLGRSLQSSV